MELENNSKFIELMNDRAFVEKLISQESPEDAQKLFASSGLELSMDDVRSVAERLCSIGQNEVELNPEQLDDVSGGVLITAATAWAVAKTAIAVGGAALAIYKWYKSR